MVSFWANLLARGAPRSEDDPDLEAAVAAASVSVMHPITGAFADPSHESAFAAHLFRLAFPVHVLLMALSLAASIWIERIAPPDSRASWGTVVNCLAMSLAGRALIHLMHIDSIRAQRIGSWTWTAFVVYAEAVDMVGHMTAPDARPCMKPRQSDPGLVAVIAIAIALVNGSHGMAFVQKFSLIALVGLLAVIELTMCGESAIPVTTCEVSALIVGAAIAQLVELHLRRSYAKERNMDEDKRRLEERAEQLQAEKERLVYDVQRRGRPLADDADDRSAIHRGLQAGSSKPHQPAGDTDAGGPAPPDSPPHSLPPGPPSSGDGESMAPTDYSSEAGGPALSDSPPPSLMPSLPRPAGPSTSSGGSIAPQTTGETAHRQRFAAIAATQLSDRRSESLAKPRKSPRSKPNAARLASTGTKKAARSKSEKPARPKHVESAPLSWEDAIRQLHAHASARTESEKAARSRYMHAVPPLSWEDADKQFYAAEAAKVTARNAAVLHVHETLAARSEQGEDVAAAEVITSMRKAVGFCSPRTESR